MFSENFKPDIFRSRYASITDFTHRELPVTCSSFEYAEMGEDDVGLTMTLKTLTGEDHVFSVLHDAKLKYPQVTFSRMGCRLVFEAAVLDVDSDEAWVKFLSTSLTFAMSVGGLAPKFFA